MAALHTDLRKLLESTVLRARDAAEKAARAALIALAVAQAEAYPSLSEAARSLRRKLRAEARRLGDGLEKAEADADPFPTLAAEVAYAHWHRLLFARFLAENDLLIHPRLQATVSIQDCAEIAEEQGRPDGWVVAAEYGAAMLPGIFPNDDPVLQVRFDASGRIALENLLAKLPREVFVADDSLGWVYQFWQAKKKAEVNKIGRKIGGPDIAPVTQLFTEHYMVEFLLHNSLGAWWAGRHCGQPLPVEMAYLRRNADGRPAAGTFAGWPSRAAELRVLDPCCGSGHFLVAAFELLRRMRMAEEGLDEASAGDAVLRDNLFGLELDPRCTQIAAFAVCLAAWKAGGYRTLPPLNLACCGLAVGDRVYEWTRLAEREEDAREREALEATLRRLWHLFRNAPDLGSLIDPVRATIEEGIVPYTESLFAQEWHRVAPLLERALAKERDQDDPAAIFGAAAEGALRAAELLTGKYTLVVTNVPYLGRGNQDTILRDHIEKFHNAAKADLATAFVERCLTFCADGGTATLVAPQNWTFLGSYKALRERLLRFSTWNLIAKLGPQAFQTPMWDYNIGLFVLSSTIPPPAHNLVGLDASFPRVPAEKAELLRCAPLQAVLQSAQIHNPDAGVVFGPVSQLPLLSKFARCYQGISTTDYARFGRNFWEHNTTVDDWEFHQGVGSGGVEYSGRAYALWFGELEKHADMIHPAIRGKAAWGKDGVAIGQMSGLPATIFTGEKFINSVPVIVPKSTEHLPAIWAFCRSPEFVNSIRAINQKASVDNGYVSKIPFDLEHWQQVAAKQYPDGLPEPYSDDPTQWLFHGHPARSTDPLQVAMARLLGYRWPEHGLPPMTSGKARQDEDGLSAFADNDGIVCLPSVAGEPPAEQHLLTVLAAAYGANWSPSVQEDLLAKAGYGGKGLGAWLRDGFFAAHFSRFHNRPFLWHLWDGEKDGFAAIVNYHQLDRKNLDRLIYTYLGDWIDRQRADDRSAVPGAGRRLKAALDLQTKLKAISHGDPPYDIYVRWKPLHKQPLGWEPDLNDGVRLNVRPFVTAGVLRGKFTVNWNKDRGTNPDKSERLNDLHLTRAAKEAARRAAPPGEAASAPTPAPAKLDI